MNAFASLCLASLMIACGCAAIIVLALVVWCCCRIAGEADERLGIK